MCASEGGSFVFQRSDHSLLSGRGGLPGALAISLLAATAGLANGQCEPAWVPAPVGPFYSNAASVSDGIVFDRDGNGPLPARLYIAARAAPTGQPAGLVEWDGDTWIESDEDFDGFVSRLITWDADGDGPNPPRLVAMGDFTRVGTSTTRTSVAIWDGQTWSSIPGLDGGFTQPTSIATRDPDFGGPLPPRLVLARAIVGGAMAGVVEWDGSTLSQVGDLTPGGIGSGDANAFVTWDRGDPELEPQFIAAGAFQNVGGELVARIASFDGVVWSPLGSGIEQGVVNALAVFDTDGGGVGASEVYAAGTFLRAGGQPVNQIARWDGSTWRAVGSGLTGGAARQLLVLDTDGSGPRGTELVALGEFTSAGGIPVPGIAAWDGSQWRAIGDGNIQNTVSRRLVAFDPDGDGPMGEVLAVAGVFSVSPLSVRGAAWLDGDSWQPLGFGIAGSQRATVPWDPDGAGPASEVLVSVGQFFSAGDQPIGGIAGWDGSRWNIIAPGATGNYFMREAATWDHDGNAATASRLIVAGSLTQIGGVAVDGIAMWDGAAWSRMGGLDSASKLITHDPDGAGALPEELFLAGSFRSGTEPFQRGVARWNGTGWAPVGLTDAAVSSAIYWDADGDGPGSPDLYIAGSFTTVDGVAATRIARWNGAAWQPLGPGLDRPVTALEVWDEDGAGPLPSRLVASVYTASGAPVRVSSVFAWDGSAWTQIGSNLTGTNNVASTSSLRAWDPDGAGPLAPWLVVAGTFTQVETGPAPGLAYFEAGASGWRALPAGEFANGADLQVWTPPGSDRSRLAVIGAPVFTAGFGPAGLSFFDRAPDVAVWDQPTDTQQRAGGRAQLVARARSGDGLAGDGYSFQWQRETPEGSGLFVDLADGPGGASPGGGEVLGASGARQDSSPIRLTIQGARQSDAGTYRVRLVNACGSDESLAARLEITPACDYDFNQDENVDLTDAQSLAQVVVGILLPEPGWLDGDVNGDENVALDDAQLIAQFVVSGVCAV
jgi:hypothetical protein